MKQAIAMVLLACLHVSRALAAETGILAAAPSAVSAELEAMSAVPDGTGAISSVQPAIPSGQPPLSVRRPAALPILYSGFAALQVWDTQTTLDAVRQGAREANPIAGVFAKNPAHLVVFKAATAATTVYFVERLWRQNRVAAVVMMAAINGVTAAVAINNSRNARPVR